MNASFVPLLSQWDKGTLVIYIVEKALETYTSLRYEAIELVTHLRSFKIQKIPKRISKLSIQFWDALPLKQRLLRLLKD